MCTWACGKPGSEPQSPMLPKDAANSKWSELNPAGQGEAGDQNYLNAASLFGIDPACQVFPKLLDVFNLVLFLALVPVAITQPNFLLSYLGVLVNGATALFFAVGGGWGACLQLLPDCTPQRALPSPPRPPRHHPAPPSPRMLPQVGGAVVAWGAGVGGGAPRLHPGHCARPRAQGVVAPALLHQDLR